jgi:anti-sigma regulatory factor (Ser/Thr protein kinase)
MPDDRFITAFIGLLDAAANRLRFHSGGQGPILHFHAATGTFSRFKPTSFPLAAMPVTSLRPALEIDMREGDILVLLSDGIYEYHDAANEQFGEARVEETIREHHGKAMAELSGILLGAVRAFAKGAPQGDDMTIVLVRRGAAPVAGRTFARRIDSLDEIFAFTAASLAPHPAERELLGVVDFVVEELFTNMVKYSPGSQSGVRIEVARLDGGVEVALTDRGVEPFDVTQAPDADVGLPAEERTPGGLGLHLIRRMVDTLAYEYSQEDRQSRITFRKMLAQPRAAEDAPRTGGEHGHD